MGHSEEQAGRLFLWDELILTLLWHNPSYREIGSLLDIDLETAHRWVTKARRRFAKLQHIPLDTLHIEPHPGERPLIGNEERARLDAYVRLILDSPRLPKVSGKERELLQSLESLCASRR